MHPTVGRSTPADASTAISHGAIYNGDVSSSGVFHGDPPPQYSTCGLMAPGFKPGTLAESVVVDSSDPSQPKNEKAIDPKLEAYAATCGGNGSDLHSQVVKSKPNIFCFVALALAMVGAMMFGFDIGNFGNIQVCHPRTARNTFNGNSTTLAPAIGLGRSGVRPRWVAVLLFIGLKHFLVQFLTIFKFSSA